MTWAPIYQGDGVPRDVELPEPPPWRTFPPPVVGTDGRGLFQPPAGLVEAVNAALYLRRPLLLTGAPGSGKSTLIDSVAAELRLGPVLRWHITSRSTLAEALYRYDVLGRIHAQRIHGDGAPAEENIGHFLQLGPLGTALAPATRPRALLIDEIDKSDLDLPSDLLDVLERGEFEIPELARDDREEVTVREWTGDSPRVIVRGRVRCAQFPFIVMTSNGERDFPAPFLRRCVRFSLPAPTVESLTQIVQAHLGTVAARAAAQSTLITSFIDRVRAGENLAVDQLLNAVFLLTGDPAAGGEQRERVLALLMRELSGA
jgi:MoxR-like ATPase